MSATTRRIDRVVDAPSRARPRSTGGSEPGAQEARDARIHQWHEEQDRLLVRAAKARRRAEFTEWMERVEGRFMGVPKDIDPHEALILCVKVAAGEAEYCSMQLQRLFPEEAFEIPVHRKFEVTDLEGVLSRGELTLSEEAHDVEVVSRWVTLRNQALDRLARYSKMALDAGVDERRVAIAEQVADVLAPLLNRLADQLELTPKQMKQLPAIIEGQLLELERSAA